MKKVLIAMTLVTIITCSVRAQSKSGSNPNIFSIGAELSLPVGTFGNVYSFGIGGSVQLEHKISSDAGLTINAGYIYYSVKSAYGSGGSGLIPLMAGVKYYFTPMVYGHAQLGAAFSTATGGGTSFVYSPGIGFILGRNFDALIKFVGFSTSGSTSNTVGLRVAYIIP